MPLFSKAPLCLDSCSGLKLPEFNLLSWGFFARSAQIIHPSNITPLLSNMEKSTWSYLRTILWVGLREDPSEIHLTRRAHLTLSTTF